MSKHEFSGFSGRFLTLRMRIVQPTSFFHKLLLGLGVCQPFKVRRQLLWNIEMEHKGKAMITMLITEMMMMMMMMMTMTMTMMMMMMMMMMTMMMMMMVMTMMMMMMMMMMTMACLNPQKPAKNPWSLRRA